MSIAQEEEDLFQRWRLSRPEFAEAGFVKDGVVDEGTYEESRPKILFVLKEANGTERDVPDLRSFLRDGGRWQTWNNVARWTRGLRGLDDGIPWDALPSIDDSARKAQLRSIAAMNLKKSPGGAHSDPALIRRDAVADQKFLNEQFALYAPDLVICCGSPVGTLVHELIAPIKPSKLRRTERGAYVSEYGDHKLMVDYWHRQNRFPSELVYYHLLDAVHEAVR